jgi:hypothetical protein
MKEDTNTRYYIDVDIKEQRIIEWGYGNRYDLIQERFDHLSHHRVFISKGQYNKLEDKKNRLS